SWLDPERPVDFFDAKGALEAVLSQLGVETWSLEPGLDRPYHPGRSARVLVGSATAGTVGELHSSVAVRFDLPGRVAVVELDVATLRDAQGRFLLRDVPRFPPVRRDLAFIVDASVPLAEVERALREAGGEPLAELRLFDVFTGTPVPDGKRSLAFAADF